MRQRAATVKRISGEKSCGCLGQLALGKQNFRHRFKEFPSPWQGEGQGGGRAMDSCAYGATLSRPLTGLTSPCQGEGTNASCGFSKVGQPSHSAAAGEWVMAYSARACLRMRQEEWVNSPAMMKATTMSGQAEPVSHTSHEAAITPMLP